MEKTEILTQINNLIKDYISKDSEEKKFIPGKTRIQFAGPIYDSNEIIASLKSLLSGWFTSGKITKEFEREFAKYMDIKECTTVNSGSSALLLAWNALKNKDIENPIKDGDEIITGGVTHTATVNSILQNNLKPVLVDIEIPSYNIDVNKIEEAITDKTRGILPMHFLGNPCDMNKIMEIAKKYNLYIVEDACDAYGSEYDGKKVGTFGDFGTVSFYTAHGITLFEGGAVLSNNEKYLGIVKSLKAWGRACASCPYDVCRVATDPEYICPNRFKDKGSLGNYDQRYMFSTIGYNIKTVEVQSAFGLEQLKKFPEFIKKRNYNFDYLVKNLKEFENYLILPEAVKLSKPVWFTLPLTIKEDAPFKRKDLVEWLEKKQIETRPFFAGYLPDQPSHKDCGIKIVGDLKNTKLTRDNSFFIGCYPGINQEMLDYIIDSFRSFFKKF